ncbi:MAG: hypothetical protein AAYR33_08525 [Acetobacteraceae bacterium]
MQKLSTSNIGRGLVATAMILALAACNTIGGAGRDVSAVGNSVSSGANAAKP